MQSKDILSEIEQHFGKNDFRWVDESPTEPFLVVPVSRLHPLAAFLKDEPTLGFETLMSISGVHQVEKPESIDVVYHLFSIRFRHRFILKVQLARPLMSPHFYLRIQTVSDIWPAAGWLEREVYDMFGVRFVGHGDFRRLLLPPDWQGHPLLKDYQEPGSYQGISTSRAEVSLEDPPDEIDPMAGTV